MTDYVETWLRGLSERTKENYRKDFEKWLPFINMSPEKQIEKRLKDTASTNQSERQFFENKFREYKEHLEQTTTLSALSVKTLLRTVASFFSRNGLPLNLKSGDWESTKEQNVIQRFKLSNEDVKAMYGHANLRDRGLLLVLYQSGFSEVDVSELKVEDLAGIYGLAENEHLFIEKPREKTGSVQATCLSYEALHDIRAMLSERGKPQTGPIFVSQTKDKGSRIESRRIHEAMKTLALKAFGKEKAKLFKTKSLRSAYNSALLRANIQPQEIKDVMMGHARKSARKHYDYDDVTIREAYARAFEHLTINGVQTRQDITRLKEQFEDTTTQLAKRITELQQQNELLQKALETKLGLRIRELYDEKDKED